MPSCQNGYRKGGHDTRVARLKDKKIRARVFEEIRLPGDDWENFYQMSGSPENILLVGFKNDTLK